MLKLIAALVIWASCALTVLGQDTFVGEIKLWPMDYAPSGWFFCDGRLLSINEYDLLFALLGTRYGGDGVQTFALPDLRNAVPLGVGPGTALATRGGGNPTPVTGTATGLVALSVANLPPHSHSAVFSGGPAVSTVDTRISVLQSAGTQAAQEGGSLAQGANSGSGAASIFAGPNASGNRVNLAGGTVEVTSTSSGTVQVGDTGFGQPLPINLNFNGIAQPALPPYLALNYIIAWTGIFTQPD